MPKFKCCRQTFYSKMLLDEHIFAHPSDWGKKSPEGSVNEGNIEIAEAILASKSSSTSSKSLSPELILTPPLTPISESPPSKSPAHEPKLEQEKTLDFFLMPMGTLVPTIADTVKRRKRNRVEPVGVTIQQQVTRRVKRRLVEDAEAEPEPEPELIPSRENWKQWDHALGILLEERNRLTASREDVDYWDLALDTLILLRNNFYSQKVCENDNVQMFVPPPKRISFVPVEEHNLVIQRMDEVRQQRDAMKLKWEESQVRSRVLEQIEKQYKAMLKVRTEEAYKVKKLMAQGSSSPEDGNFLYGLYTISHKSMTAL